MWTIGAPIYSLQASHMGMHMGKMGMLCSVQNPPLRHNDDLDRSGLKKSTMNHSIENVNRTTINDPDISTSA
jgi:hypothetical protein